MTILPSSDTIERIHEQTIQAAEAYMRCLRQSLACLDFSQTGNKVKGHTIMNLLADIQNAHSILEGAYHDAATIHTPIVTNVR